MSAAPTSQIKKSTSCLVDNMAPNKNFSIPQQFSSAPEIADIDYYYKPKNNFQRNIVDMYSKNLSLNLKSKPLFEKDESTDIKKDSKNKFHFGSFLRQACCVSSVTGVMLFSGLVIGWANTLPKMVQDEALHFQISTTDVKWLVSLVFVASIPANLLTGNLMELLGPRTTCQLVFLPGAALWLLMAYPPNVYVLYFTRLCLGFLMGVANTVAILIATELCEPAFRGILLAIPEVQISTGILLSYILAHFVSWKTVALVSSLPMFINFCTCLFVPESPYWLMRHKGKEAAETSLKKLLGNNREDQIKKMLDEISQSVNQHDKSSTLNTIKLLKRPCMWMPVVLLASLLMFRELAGQNMVFAYTVNIFQSAGTSLNPFLCTILVGLIKLVGTIVMSIFVEKVGRRPLFLSNVFVCTLCMFVAGGSLLIGHDSHVANMITLGCILTWVAAFGFGVGGLLWTLVGELMPSPIRSLGLSIVITWFSLTVFGLTNIFPDILELVGIGGIFIIFGINSTILFIVAYKYLPETRNKSLLELETIFISNSRDSLIQDISPIVTKV